MTPIRAALAQAGLALIGSFLGVVYLRLPLFTP
jgi:hypothetical protein